METSINETLLQLLNVARPSNETLLPSLSETAAGRSTVVWCTTDIVYVLAESVVALATLIVNSLVIGTFIRYHTLVRPSSLYILNLALADCLVALLVWPLCVVVHLRLIDDFHLCVLLNSLVGVFTNTSILSLVCVVRERYLITCNPFHVETTKTALMACLLSWVLASIVGMAPLMGWHKHTQGFSVCHYRTVIPLEYNVYLQLFGFLLPVLLAMLVVHTRVFLTFRRSNKVLFAASRQKQGSRPVNRTLAREKKLFKSLALIFILFAVCWLPLYIANSIRLFSPGVYISLHVELAFVVLTHTNSFVNPIIYAFGQPELGQFVRGGSLFCSPGSFLTRCSLSS